MQDVREFIEFNRPQVRQDQLIKHVTTAFKVDQSFKTQFAALRLILREEMKDWGDLVITNLINHHHLPPDFPQDQMEIARELFMDHRKAVLAGDFDDDYFASVENFSLFFIYHNVIPLFVVGAIKSRVDHMIEKTVTSKSSSGRLHAIASLVTFLALEGNQIQRVFIAYHGGSALDILNKSDPFDGILFDKAEVATPKAKELRSPVHIPRSLNTRRL